MRIKRAVLMAVLVVAVAALAVPLVGVGARTAGTATATTAAKARSLAQSSAAAQQPSVEAQESEPVATEAGKLSPEQIEQIKQALGIIQPKDGRDVSQKIARAIRGGAPRGGFQTQSGQPLVMNAASALSASLITTIGGRDNQFSEVTLIADWDGREDCVADREQKLDDFSFAEIEIDFTLTKAAISEHTVANGFLENVYYYGDSVGNLWVGTDTNPGVNAVADGAVDIVSQVNIPELVNTGTTAAGAVTLLNPQAGDCTDDQITVTGIAVQPVADLGDFGLCDTIGEVVYVSTLDTEGCSSNAANQVFRTRIFAFGFTDTPGIFGGVTPVGAIQILRNSNFHTSNITLDDDGSLYFQLTDNPLAATNAAIFKVCEMRRTVAGCQINPRVNRVIASIPSGLTGGIAITSAQGTGASPVLTAGGYRLTNYSLPSTTFGNVVAMDGGPCNVIYAALARSFVSTDDGFTQLTEGNFTNPAALGATPSMIISFADCSGAFDTCTSPAPGVPGQIPVGDGFADGPAAGVARVAGVNNFRVFALGNGPDIRPAAGSTSAIVTADTLKIDMQIDYTLHSGLAVNEEGTVYVISGGTPAGIGKNPSPMLGEVLCFPDACPMDRRADFIDFRGNAVPNPPASGGNVGDGDSDRFDHIFYQSPLDQITLTPGGMSGLAHGFLRHTNRLAPGVLAAGDSLGVTGGTTVLGDDDTTVSPIIFETLDPGHQVAGGDDQNTPFRGDDNDGAGNPVLVGALSGGFEFNFGGTNVAATCVWNGFFWNSNGNITFGVGDTSNFPTVPDLRTGPPRLAPAWADVNPAARAVDPSSFPVLALGFVNVNAFKVRWINVPEFGNEDCTGPCGGATNTFAVTLYDDGTGRDENEAQLLDPADPTGDNVDPAYDEQEGPTDNRFVREPNTGVIVGCPPRPEGSGIFQFEYCRMDLLGTLSSPVIVGYSIGGLSPLNPPGLCETNLGEAARAADAGTFGVIQSQTAAIGCNCTIGEGTEPTLFELFNSGSDSGIGDGGEIVFATPDFDLRFEGNDAALCTPARQRDANRGKITFLGVGCAPPANPLCQVVVPGPFVTATPPAGGVSQGTDLVDALCAVQLNIVGCGFFPNESTIICQGFVNETGVPLQRPGKTVSTAVTLTCDTNGDGVPEAVITLGNVTPVSCNLVTATLLPISTLPGTAFPAACCGGIATVTVTTTFTAGDNNIFGPFTRTTVCSLALGTRAPIVFSVTPSDGNCAVPQDVLISGACFTFQELVPGVGLVTRNVTSVFAVEQGTGRIVQATSFVILNANLIDAFFNFGTGTGTRTFRVFVTGPGGTSRNLSAPVAGAPAGCPLGNEQGNAVTFTCNPTGTPGNGGQTPLDLAVITNCRLSRSSSGTFRLDITGRNIKRDATVTIGGVAPRKVKFRELEPGSNNSFSSIRAQGRVCRGLPGNIIVTNPGTNGGPSQPFNCTERCPTN